MFTIDPGRFLEWYGVLYMTLLNFQTVTGHELNAISADSQFADSDNDVFTLLVTSPCIDKGEIIDNFNDANSPWFFMGAAPDMGAYEYGLE